MLMKRFALLLLFTGIANAQASGADWSYEGETGPDAWGHLSPSFAACAVGRNQSPVDIRGAFKATRHDFRADYRHGGEEILNTGHTVQINFAPGDTLKLDDGVYELKQVHFHTPSENRIAGKSFPLEAHFVHMDTKGNAAVIAVMFQEGKANPAIKRISAFLPYDTGLSTKLMTKMTANQMMPPSKKYYRFSGSLTTPPCSEGVRWLVMKQPLNASKEQIQNLAKAMHSHNSRPVQPLNGRVIVD